MNTRSRKYQEAIEQGFDPSEKFEDKSIKITQEDLAQDPWKTVLVPADDPSLPF